MSKANNLTDFLTAVANAIRAKKGTSALINPQDFDTEIANLPSGGASKLPQVVDRSVTSITAEDLAGATSIGTSAFYLCQYLKSITIPNAVTSIGNSAFSSCTALTNIMIGNGVTNIGDYAFYNCTSLISITIEATTPPTLGGFDVFRNTNNCTIYVPASSVTAYQTANNWRSYASRIQAIPS